MGRRAAACVAAVLALALGGCGTALNVLYWDPEEGGRRVYGGVKADACAVRDSARVVVSSERWGDRLRGTWATFFAAVDLPLSAVADTLVLPVTVPITVKDEDEPDPPAEAPGKKAAAPHRPPIPSLPEPSS